MNFVTLQVNKGGKKIMDMMQQRQLYPIGIQTFSEIRGKGYLYIDKTEYVYRVTHPTLSMCF